MTEDAEEASCQLSDVTIKAERLQSEARSLRSQMDKCIKTRDDTTNLTNKRSRRANMLRARISSLSDKLNSLKRKDLTGCNMEIVHCKVASPKKL